jgi:PAS domain S-box-containing protein
MNEQTRAEEGGTGPSQEPVGAAPADLTVDLLDSLREGIVTLDRAFRITAINREGLHIDGRPREEIVGRSHWEVWPASLGTPVEAAYRRAMVERVPVELEYHYLSGRHDVWLEILAQPIDEGLAVLYRDVTRRKRAEAAMAQVVAELEAIYRAVPVGVAVLDRELRYVRVNDALAAINGLPARDHIGRTLQEIVPQLADAAEPLFRAVPATGEPLGGVELEGETAARPGERRVWLGTAAPVRDADGSVRWIVVALLDITEHRRTERALRQSEARFRVSQELALDPFTILRAVRDDVGHVVDFAWEYANPAALRALRGEGEALVGQRLLERLPGNREHPALFPRYVRALATGGADEVELRYEADGVTGWFRNAVTRIDPERIAVTFRDITRRKQAEAALQALLAEKERLAQHNALVAREIAHRIMNCFNLLASLLGIQARSIAEPAVRTALDGARERVQAMAVLQRRLFQATREDVSALDMREYLEGLARELAAAFVGERCALVVEAPPGTLVAIALASSLGMIVSELVINACKHAFGKDGTGHLWIRVEPDGPGRYRLSVADDGPGLPEGLDPRQSRGLGMTLVRSLVQQLDGTLEIDGSPPGTRFTISFPA